MKKHLEIRLSGVVQGVGFRPFVYNLAHRYNLPGFVFNDDHGVQVDVEGDEVVMEDFVEVLIKESPPQSRIEKVSKRFVPLVNFHDFRIEDSRRIGGKFVQISKDLATCDDCLRELFDPNDRRYRYPFINCTNCGPRFTIIKDIPYDRPFTTMAPFITCPECQAEYDNPTNRRFHAQPNACPVCGPKLELWSAKPGGQKIDSDDEIADAYELLKQGKIIAIKGLGGFHLACDALNNDAVKSLRSRKYREDKPFAVMMADIESISRYCEVNTVEENLLNSVNRPIVLLNKKSVCPISEAVAPKYGNLGVMLPYTPLHHLLLRESGLVLVMTSGNVSDEPIAYRNDEAMTRLRNIADYFLVYNRDIYIRSDDSVTRVVLGKEVMLRRSRGYVPEPISLNFSFKKPVLACGPELKNTFCLARDNLALVAHHIGDLENLETLKSFEEGIEHFQKIFYTKPEVIAYDLHPNYLSTKYALELIARNPQLISVGVQHHFAHIASCIAENGVGEKVIGIALDGTGYGTDGTIWGGEVLIADFHGFERVAHFDPVPMPGGERAIKEPWRMAVSYLYHTFGKDFIDNIPLAIVGGNKRGGINKQKIDTILKMIDSNVNCPLTSSCGRLFDGIAALIGLRDTVHYEGQAAVELENIIFKSETEISNSYSFKINNVNGMMIISTDAIIKQVTDDISKKLEPRIVSLKFHNVLVQIFTDITQQTKIKTGLDRVALSGGCFQNVYLLTHLKQTLEQNGFKVYTHSKVPPNDGGISLGQAAIANFQIEDI
jgi:hydrogenase maturation protein HypF